MDLLQAFQGGEGGIDRRTFLRRSGLGLGGAAVGGTGRRDPGDRVIVSTKNSVYCLDAVGDDQFVVSGGWFEKHDCSRLVTVNGCTFGGRAIKSDVVAAPGLFLEFENRVTTTRIQEARVLRGDESRPC